MRLQRGAMLISKGKPQSRPRNTVCAPNGAPHPVTGSRVVLTVAHLDHTPENCEAHND
jgi:hypothetical protein